MMNSDDDRLIGRYFDGTLSPEQKGALQKLLTQSAEARKRFRLLATIEDGLAERGQESASVETHMSPAPLPLKETGRGPMWRPLAVRSRRHCDRGVDHDSLMGARSAKGAEGVAY